VTIGSVLAASLAILAVGSILVLQSAWFANFVRQKIIAVAEESTGGVVEIGSFQFDWRHLTVRIHNFVLHGSEPRSADPLFRARELELRLKLLAGLKQAVDLEYLGIQQPQVNLIVLPDGTTNIPQPKIQHAPSQKTGLETVVDLAIHRFEIRDGLIEYAQQKNEFSARGEDLRALLNYNPLHPGYQGSLSVDPLLLKSGPLPPLRVQVNLPLTIEKDAITVADAKLSTEQSQVLVNASLHDLNSPVISAHLNASVSLPEMQRSLNLPIDANARNVPKVLTADLTARFEQKNNMIEVRTAHLGLGQTTFQASGILDPAANKTVQFSGNFALAELSPLFKVASPQTSGELQLNGNAKLDGQNNYAIDGTVNSRALSIGSGATRISNLSLYSPFHADPYLVSLDGLKLNALGGGLTAKIFLEKMRNLSAEGSLRNLSVPVLTGAITGKRLAYGGMITGSIGARGDVKTKNYSAQARLNIAPGPGGVLLSGRLDANYVGSSGVIVLDRSYLVLPHSRVDLSGSLNKQVDVTVVSNNLNDFLPAANLGAAGPLTELPIALEGGTAKLQAQISGVLSAPHIAAHADLDRFAVERRSFDRFALDLAASSTGIAVQNGLLTRKALQTNFDGSLELVKWQPLSASALHANLTLRHADLEDLLSLAGETEIPASGEAIADVHIAGTYGDPLGSAAFKVLNGAIYEQPFERISANVNLADRLITLTNLELDAAGGTVKANGTFQHPSDSFAMGHAQFHAEANNIQLSNVVPLQRQHAGATGLVQFTAGAGANFEKENGHTEMHVSSVAGDLTARGLRVQNQDAGDLTATVRTTNGALNYHLTSGFAGSNIQVNGRTTLTKDYPTEADASIQNLALAKALAISGQTAIPARGDLSAKAHFAGTMQMPMAQLSFALTRANVYLEPINRLDGSLRYSATLVDIPSLTLDTPAGRLTVAGSFTHKAGDFNGGLLKLRLDSSDLQLAKIEHARQAEPGIAGTLHLAADLSASLRDQHGKSELLVSNLDAGISVHALQVDSRKLGAADFVAKTTGSNLNFRLDSDIAGSQIHGSGQSQLSGEYSTHASLTFSNVRYTNIAPFLSAEPELQPAFDALVEGQASLNGPLLNSGNLTGRLQLDRFDIRTNPHGSPTGAPSTRSIDFQNDGPIVVALNHSVVQLQQFHVQGPGTSVTASGAVNLKNAKAPLGLNLKANADLAVLQDVNRDFYSSGQVVLDATIHGSFAQPLLNGRVELKNTNVNYAESPNGLSNGNGVILLNGTNAAIQNLTGESGGGKIALAGFVGFGTSSLSYNLRAAATNVRTRYSGISVTSSANLSLIGNSRRSLLGGTVTIHRIAYSSSSDAGSILSLAATPPSTPTAPSPLLSRMRLAIRIVTAADLRVVTTYANRLEVFSNLTIRGTAETPGILGRVDVTNGQLVFFGNTYTVNTGTINFYDPNAIDPILNVSLETVAQGVDVLIDVSGPMNNLKLSYRSDPPLTFQQIVQLLATNTTPADPTIAARQPVPQQQSLSQMGESAVLGQAVANPLASRVQRVFGLTQFKIDPSFSGSNGQPSARVTLQEKIASNITFTYITDVTQTNSEIVRVEWDLTSRLSAVALRDFNGNVSLEFFYKFKVR
jgi:translocation and assembly module TamB